MQGGTIDTKSTFAVGIQVNGGDVCSGVLIAPNLVMTAQHCVAWSNASKVVDCKTDEFTSKPVSAPSVVVTTDASLPGKKRYKVDHVVVPDGREVCGADLALLVLSSNVPDTEATPATPQLQPMASRSRVSASGFGATGGTVKDAGQRRTKQNIPISCVAGVDSDCATGSDNDREFLTSGGVCKGDSGSGAFEQRSFASGKPVVLGILSRYTVGADGDCLAGVYARTDMHAPLIIGAALMAAKRGRYQAPSWALSKSGEVPSFEVGNDAGYSDGGVDAASEPASPPFEPTNGDIDSTDPWADGARGGSLFEGFDWDKLLDFVTQIIPALKGVDTAPPREDRGAPPESKASDTSPPAEVTPSQPPGGDRMTAPRGADRSTRASDPPSDSDEAAKDDGSDGGKATESSGCSVKGSFAVDSSGPLAVLVALLVLGRRRRRDAS